MSARHFPFVLFLLTPISPYSNIGQGHVHGIGHHAVFECGAVGKSEKCANRKVFRLITTLLSTSVSGPLFVKVHVPVMSQTNLYFTAALLATPVLN